jgi:hypothetical protein
MKLLVVERCVQCIYHNLARVVADSKTRCALTNKSISNPFKMPKHCPLPNAPKSERG